MNEILSSEITRLENTFAGIETNKPFLKPIVDAFREIIINNAILRSKISERLEICVPPPDDSFIVKGQPLLAGNTIASLVDPFGENIESAMNPLNKAFPAISSDILIFKKALGNNAIDLKSCIRGIMENDEQYIAEITSKFGLSQSVFQFIIVQILKPFIEKRTEGLRNLIKNINWLKGYCPICGSLPEMSYLDGIEGQRWLKCSLCNYDWRYDRMTCPYCENKGESKEILSAEGFENEWVELCNNCNKYIVGIDLRNHNATNLHGISISLVYLDIIAQQKGFEPVAVCAWNMVLSGEHEAK